MNQCVYFVAVCETFDQAGLMLIDPLFDVICDPGIQRSGLVGHDIDEIGLADRHGVIIYGRAELVEAIPLRIVAISYP